MKGNYIEHLTKLQSESNYLNDRISLLIKYEKLYKYFEKLSFKVSKRNVYINIMQVIMAQQLFKEGLNQYDISIILHKDHSSMTYIFKQVISPLKDEIYYFVKNNMDNWIENEVYPFTAHRYVSKKERIYINNVKLIPFKLKSIYSDTV